MAGHLPVSQNEIYHCFERAKTALFDTVDALLAETQAQSGSGKLGNGVVDWEQTFVERGTSIW